MKLNIEIIRSKNRLPKPYATVIVDGGIAMWTGHVWKSLVYDGRDFPREIQWDVEWWTPLITSSQIDNSEQASQ